MINGFVTYRWSLIAGRLPGRTDNEVKNYWNSHLRKKLDNKGIYPINNHRLAGNNPPLMSGSSSASSSFNSLKDNKVAKNDDVEPYAQNSSSNNNKWMIICVFIFQFINWDNTYPPVWQV